EFGSIRQEMPQMERLSGTCNTMRQVAKAGFSLVEVLIVVVVMGILAAVIVPQFSGSGETARYAATVEYLQSMRSQIDLYRNQHQGKYPGLAGADPDI